jgi:hypothetical protein
LEGTNLIFGTSSLEIKKDGNLCFRSENNIENLEIHSSHNGESGFVATIYKTKSDSLGIPKGNIELNAIDVSERSKVLLELKRNPVMIDLRVEKGEMKGRINTETFYLVVEEGEVKSKSDERISCSGNLEITGKLIPAFPLRFGIKSNGRVVIVNPLCDEDGLFLNEGHREKSINNIVLEISNLINSNSVRQNYIRYSPIESGIPKKIPYSAGERISLASERNFDINLLRISPSGIDFVSETQSKKIFVDDRLISPNLLENAPRHWLCIVGIFIFFLDKVVIAVVLRRVQEK